MKSTTINGVSIGHDELGRDEGVTTRFYIVHFDAPIDNELRSRLHEVLEVLEVVSAGSLICKSKDERVDLQLLRAKGLVAFPYSARFKVRSSEFAASSVPTEACVVAHVGEDSASLWGEICRRQLVASKQVVKSKRTVRGAFSNEEIQMIAQLDGVRCVVRAPVGRLSSPVAAGLMRINAPLRSQFSGKGEIISITDTGFDKGRMDDVHPAFADRVIAIEATAGNTPDDRDGHGTFLASCALGYGLDQGGQLAAAGVASSAKLVSLCIAADTNSVMLSDDIGDIFFPLRERYGVRVHNMSFNQQEHYNCGIYTVWSGSVDRFVWEHRDAVICISVGNSGDIDCSEPDKPRIASGTVQPPSTAKNAVAVGASENNRPDWPKTWGDLGIAPSPFSTDRIADNPKTVAVLSARGPGAHGRLGPHVVAPGISILAAASRNAGEPGSAIYGQKPDDSRYCFNGGTSFSAAFASGACAVIREWLRTAKEIPVPSAALVKAVLVNGSTPLCGSGDDDYVPDFSQGFGLINLTASLSTTEIRDEAGALSTGQTATFDVEVPADSTLTITLAWADPEGEGVTNSLNLIARDASGAERHGNRKVGDSSFDAVNNVQRLRWSAPNAGGVQIKVVAGDVWKGPQNYALAWTISQT